MVERALFVNNFLAKRDAFVTDVDTSRPGNNALYLVFLFAAEGTNVRLPPLFMKYLDGLRAHLLQIDAQALQHAGGDALAFAHQAQQQMLGADVMMIQAARFIDGQLDHLFGARRQADFAQHDAVAPPNNKFNGAANLVQFNAQITQYFGGNALALTHQTEQQMLGADVVVLEALRFFLGQAQHFPGSFCKPVKPISIVHLFVTPLSVAESGTVPSVMLR